MLDSACSLLSSLAEVFDIPAGTWIGFLTVWGFLHIVAETVGRKDLVYLFKPGTMVGIILMTLNGRSSSLCTEASFLGDPDLQTEYRELILIGLGFSILGDIFLMLRRQQFILGLLSFLTAHLLYIYAFAQPSVRPDLKVAGVLALVSFAVIGLLWRKLGGLKIPVLFYVGAIMTMLWFALGRYENLVQNPWDPDFLIECPGPLYAALGAGLFVVSDTALAFGKFYGSYPGDTTLVMVTYFTAQFLIGKSTFV